jgi:hypothetical protein
LSTDEDILGELREQTTWLRLLGFQALKPVLQAALKTDRHRAIDEYSDGKRTTREVAELAGAGATTVSRMWSEWLESGICTESASRPGRAQHLAPLSRLGIELRLLSGRNGLAKDDDASHE